MSIQGSSLVLVILVFLFGNQKLMRLMRLNSCWWGCFCKLFQNIRAAAFFSYLFVIFCLSKTWKLMQDIFAFRTVHFKVFILENWDLLLKPNVDCLAVRQEICRSITGNCRSKLKAKSFAAKDLCKVRKNYGSNPNGFYFGFFFLK